MGCHTNNCNIILYDKIQILYRWSFNIIPFTNVVIPLPNVVILLLNIEISLFNIESGYYLDKITIFLISSLFYYYALV